MKKKIKRNRGHTKGFDERKIIAIVNALRDRGDWIYINEIARDTGLKPETVRYYLVNHLNKFIDTKTLSPNIRARFVRLKADYEPAYVIKALNEIKKVGK